MRWFIFLVLFLAGLTAHANVPAGNAAYLFDFRYDAKGDKKGHHPGLFSDTINSFNRLAPRNNKISQLYTYAGDMEMFCGGASGSRKNKTCKPDDLMIFYGNGARSAKVYGETVNGYRVDVIPVVDGRVDRRGSKDYLSAFNTLNEESAIIYADKVAAVFCQDPRVSGVQFVIEPFDLNQPGQFYFYQRIARNFAGKNCKDDEHPEGRFFSVFTTASQIDEQVGKVLNQYKNGYAIIPLYGLGTPKRGIALSPGDYKRLIHRELTSLLEKSDQYQVKFQIAIPVAATEHEFESRSGKPSEYRQLEYIEAAISEMNKEKLRDNKNFLGVALWAYMERLILNNHEYLPAQPDDETVNYLMKNL